MPEIDTAHEAVPASEQAEKRTEQTHSLLIGNAIGGQVTVFRSARTSSIYVRPVCPAALEPRVSLAERRVTGGIALARSVGSWTAI